jgi:predicted transcriptional regulator
LSTTPTPTPRELDILKVLWDQGPVSVRVVHRELQRDEPDLAYNTVQTLLRIMEAKSLVRHTLDGRTFIYAPEMTRDESRAQFLGGVLRRVFDGAAEQLVSSLLSSEHFSAEELDRMQALIDEARRRKAGS